MIQNCGTDEMFHEIILVTRLSMFYRHTYNVLVLMFSLFIVCIMYSGNSTKDNLTKITIIIIINIKNLHKFTNTKSDVDSESK